MAKNKLNNKQLAFLQAYEESNGILYTALRASKTRLSEYRKWKEESPLFAEEVDMVQLQAVAKVEERMFEIINNKGFIDDVLIKFYLTSKGGYDKPKESKDKTKDDYEVVFGK